MRKILLIAKREYLAMVGAKAFIISVALMPILMLGGAIVPQLLRKQVDMRPKKIVVLDGTNRVWGPLSKAIEVYNQTRTKDPETGEPTAPPLILTRGPEGPVTDELRLQLSNEVRNADLHAFVEIPANLLDAATSPADAHVNFYCENAPLSDARRVIEGVLGEVVRTYRLEQEHIDSKAVARAGQLSFHGQGLFARASDGSVRPAGEENMLVSLFLPMGIMMFMFMVTMMSAQPMLESVLEEKTNRIAEVLLGSAKPFQLMAGKLLGNVAGSLTVVAIYAVGLLGLAVYRDALDIVPWRVVPWLIVFQVLAVVMFSSLFLAIGASVNQLKEAQSLLLPVWIFLVIPMFVWLQAVKEPMGNLAIVLSLVPPFTPLLMCLRMAASSAIPLWQPVLGVVLVLATTIVCVTAAGRVFRVGMLAQGKAPSLGQLLRWVVTP